METHGWYVGGCRVHRRNDYRLCRTHGILHQKCSSRVSCTRISSVAGRPMATTTAAAAAAETMGVSLDSLDLEPVLDEFGAFSASLPECPAVFAMYDKEQEIQYIGFSSTLRRSIEKMFYRRPEKAYYCKYLPLEVVDQEAMVKIRNDWFDSLNGPPIGNVNMVEKEAWQLPPEAVATSEGGTLVAAQEQAAMMMTQIRNRGCTVDVAPEPALLQKGIIEFVTLTPEEMERIRKEKERMADMIKHYTFENATGEEEGFDLLISSEFKTNGGYMYDVILMHDSRETTHRVIVGKKYFKHGTFEPEDVLGAVFGFILKTAIPRQTEGILSSTQFSANYFSVAEVHQCFPEFEKVIPVQIDGDSFWRFQRVETYGYSRDDKDAAKLNRQFNPESSQ